MSEDREQAPVIRHPEVKTIMSQGSQILLPFNIGDAPISFPSRWELARSIEAAIDDALLERD